jgi:hypothetical protein
MNLGAPEQLIQFFPDFLKAGSLKIPVGYFDFLAISISLIYFFSVSDFYLSPLWVFLWPCLAHRFRDADRTGIRSPRA